MYQILVVWALSQELNIIKQQIKKTNIKGFKIDFLQTWMWNYNSVFALTKKLEQKRYDFVVNIWVCGYFWEQQYDVYQISNIINVFNQKELIAPTSFIFSKLTTCISSDLPVSNYQNNEISFLNKNIKISNIDLDYNFFIIDMESFGLEFVLEKYNIARVFLKVPIDKIWKETEDFDYNLALSKLANSVDYSKLFENIKTFLDKNKKQEDNLEKYFAKLKLSTRQKEIFAFLYKKYKFVVWDDFDDYFDSFLSNYKNIDKKLSSKFLQNLEEELS